MICFIATKKKLKDDAVKDKLRICGINDDVYINANLCPYNKMLWGKCRRLYDKQMIDRFWVFNGSLYIAQTEEDDGFKISHVNDIVSKFPEFDLKPVESI